MILCIDTVCCSAAMDTTFVAFVEPLLQLFTQVSYLLYTEVTKQYSVKLISVSLCVCVHNWSEPEQVTQ